jgi:hypothetical protein
MTSSTLNYLAAMPEKPVYYYSEPPPGQRWRNTRGDRRPVEIEDARELRPPAHLDREGFALTRRRSRAGDLYDPAQRELYFREVETWVREESGAARVLVFDHNLRSGAREEGSREGVQAPVRFVHNDYTEASAPQRVRDLLGDEAEALLRRRFAVINVWKPLRGPILETPLAVCDARSIRPGDLVATDLHYPDRRGEVYSLTWDPAHRWFYYPQMRPDEVLLMKCYDSAPDRARFTAHTAFDDPGTPSGTPARESIEVRTLAFFGPD